MKLHVFVLMMVPPVRIGLGQGLECDFREYRPLDGPGAAVKSGELHLNWKGEDGQSLRAIFAVVQGQPLVRELAIRTGSGDWRVLAHNLTPEFDVVSGRRLSEQQAAPCAPWESP